MSRTERGYLPLNFSSVCQIISSVLPGEHTQSDIVYLVYSLVFPSHRKESMREELYPSPSAASKYFSNQHGINRQVRDLARENITYLIQENLNCQVLSLLNDEQKQSLLLQFQELVNQLSQDDDPMNLHWYTSLSVPQDEAGWGTCSRFISKCIRFSLLMPNTAGAKIRWGLLNDSPNVGRKSDPYRLVYQDPGSSAVELKLVDECYYSRAQRFHSFDRLTETILRRNLILRRISWQTGSILVWYSQFDSPGFQFRRLKRSDFSAAREFIRAHGEEFHRKRSWNGRELCDMVYHGLNTGIWTAYAYFDPSGNMIAYLDAKYRQDGGVELGALLTDPAYRGMQLASSLICFFQLLFPYNRLFGGTYAENKPMRNTFSSTHFTQIQYYDSRLCEHTSTVKERIHPDHPDDPSFDTDSVYYFSESLLIRAYQAALKHKG